ncbi:hypothetical protein DMB68_21175 [Flavobacterium hydrophilum]|uniref:Uncharacterized protein n=1 Tax=Flavobacterium hydrophilum TaxID=2211445 RepID=A0A2V4BX44_9FLAO|nr:hypothetical protein DMB68_21175 [Flavobacterium hydrophilum]
MFEAMTFIVPLVLLVFQRHNIENENCRLTAISIIKAWLEQTERCFFDKQQLIKFYQCILSILYIWHTENHVSYIRRELNTSVELYFLKFRCYVKAF